MNQFRRAICAVVLLALGACAGQGYGTKQTVGTLAGAGLGGLAGATIVRGKGRLAATAAGTLLGAFLGNAAGTSLDRADEVYASRAEVRTLEAPAGSALPWRDPDMAAPASTDGAGDPPCHTFRREATSGDPSQAAYVTACRDSHGRWQVVD